MPGIVFVLDVSVGAIQSGMFQACCQAISAYISRWISSGPSSGAEGESQSSEGLLPWSAGRARRALS